MAPSDRKRRFQPAKVRIALIGVIVLVAWIGMGYRLVQIQVFEAPQLSQQGLNQRFVSRDLAPQRGKIYDRNGDVLAMTVESKSLYAVPDQVDEPLWVAQQVGGILGVNADKLLRQLSSDRNFVYLKRQVDEAVADQILEMELLGVYSHPDPKRIYPAGEVASHVIGFVNIDGIGQEGVELVYDGELTGAPGKAEFERALDGTPILQGISNITPAVPGVDLNTTIDIPLQYQAQQACLGAVELTSADSCWVVALHVETGELLAMTGVPVFDPVTRRTVDPVCEADAEDPRRCREFFNFVVRGMFEPGSTQKLITVAAALEEETVQIGTVIPQVSDVLELREGACQSVDDGLFGCYRDFNEHETRDMTVAEIFTRSSNVGTIKIADTLGEDRLVDYIRSFGIGSKTGVDYSVESPGLINVEASCEICWASASIGYSVAASPLQMAAAYAVIGNDGVWTTPHIVRSTTDVEGDTVVAGIESRRVVSESTALLMRELLASVVENGTGGAAAIDGYRVGGKTGTANKLAGNGRYTKETRASFVGLAPVDDPKVVVAVVIDSPSLKYRTGGAAAAPVFAKVMEQALHRLGVTPDDRSG